MKNVPKSIFLNLGYVPIREDDFNELSQVTWSVDNATGNGLEYCSIEKALRFAEWTSMFFERDNSDEKDCLWYICADDEKTFTTAELFTSPEFLTYLNESK